MPNFYNIIFEFLHLSPVENLFKTTKLMFKFIQKVYGFIQIKNKIKNY